MFDAFFQEHFNHIAISMVKYFLHEFRALIEEIPKITRLDNYR